MVEKVEARIDVLEQIINHYETYIMFDGAPTQAEEYEKKLNECKHELSELRSLIIHQSWFGLIRIINIFYNEYSSTNILKI